MKKSTLALRICAVLIAAAAIRNILKPLGFDMGLMFFGHSLSGVANALVAPLLGAVMLLYVRGLWTLRRYALPLGAAYAAYVVVNVSLFPVFQPLHGNMGVAGYVIFALLAAGVPLAAVLLLARRRHELR